MAGGPSTPETAGLAGEAARLGVEPGDGRWDDDDYPAELEMVLAAAPVQVSFTFGCPEVRTARRLHAARCSVAVTVTGRDDAEAARAAGADAVIGQVGTALLCTPEAGTSDVHRRALMERRYDATVLTRAFSGRWARGLANRFAAEHPDAPRGYPYLHHVTRPLRAAATRQGDPDVANLWAGTGWLEARAEPAADVISRLAAGC